MTAVVDIEWAGVVRITYRRALARHRKHSHWFWHAVRADLADQAAAAAARSR